MKKPNYVWMLQNWQQVVKKLCEECTTHDVLEVFCLHVDEMADQLDSAGMSSRKVREAASKIREALSLLDPEV